MVAVPCDQSPGTSVTIEVAGRTSCMLTLSDVRERFPEYRDLPLPEVVRRSYQRGARFWMVLPGDTGEPVAGAAAAGPGS